MERALELIHKYLDGVAVAAELSELETLVLAHTDVADAFAAATPPGFLSAPVFGPSSRRRPSASLLTASEAEQVPTIARTPPRRRRRLFVFGGVALAASLLLAIGIAYYALRGSNTAGTQVLAGRFLVNGVESNQVGVGSQVRVVGEQNAVLRLADGSRLELTPNTEAVVHGRTAAHRELIELHSGGGKFDVAQGTGNFQIDTTVGEVTVLGTSFTVLLQTPEQLRREKVRVRPDWKLTVAVTSGSVQVRQEGARPSWPPERATLSSKQILPTSLAALIALTK